MEKFSQDLCTECKGTGVTVQTLAPGFVGTNMISHVRPSFFSPSADTVAITSLQSLGLGKKLRKKSISIIYPCLKCISEDRTAGFWLHKIQVDIFLIVGFFFFISSEYFRITVVYVGIGKFLFPPEDIKLARSKANDINLQTRN